MQDEMTRIDPEGRYQLGELRQFERFVLRVLDVLHDARVERARDVVQITENDERGIIVFVTPEAIELRLPTLEWPHPGIPGPCSHLWKRVMWDRISDAELSQLLQEAQQARARQFTTCRFCGQQVPPEHRHERDVCHGCAEAHLGIVH